MLAITYDTIALFYIFSSLFLGDDSTPSAVAVPFLDRSLDPLSAAWLYSMAFLTAWLYAVWLVFGLDVGYTEWEKRYKASGTNAQVSCCVHISLNSLLYSPAPRAPFSDLA